MINIIREENDTQLVSFEIGEGRITFVGEALITIHYDPYYKPDNDDPDTSIECVEYGLEEVTVMLDGEPLLREATSEEKRMIISEIENKLP